MITTVKKTATVGRRSLENRGLEAETPGYAEALLDQFLPEKRVLSSKELAEAFGVDERTIRRLAEAYHDSAGQEGIPGFKIGKLWRFNVLQLRTYLKRRMTH